MLTAADRHSINAGALRIGIRFDGRVRRHESIIGRRYRDAGTARKCRCGKENVATDRGPMWLNRGHTSQPSRSTSGSSVYSAAHFDKTFTATELQQLIDE